MKGKKHIRFAVAALSLSALCGCSQVDGTGDEAGGGNTWDVPVSFVVQSSASSSATAGSSWDNGENPPYANVRGLYTDRIQLNVYKRTKDGAYADDADGFVFDKKVVLTCAVPGGAYLYPHYRYAYATGVVNMDKAYEYRVTAVGYAEQRRERALFSITESGAFADAEVSLTDAVQYATPELFFGTPRYGADMTDKEAGTVVFSYESGAVNALGGWLYRCVAGAELTLMKVPPEVKALALVADSVNTQCKSTCYDDFKTPEGKNGVAEVDGTDGFVLDTWTRPRDWVSVYGVAAETDSIDVVMDRSNLFPVTSTLYVRITLENEDGGDDEIMAVPLRMKMRTDSNGDVITPDAVNTDAQLAEGTLVFERNHYYRIAGEYERLITKKLPLVIIVNPNWDGDIDLTPGGK